MEKTRRVGIIDDDVAFSLMLQKRLEADLGYHASIYNGENIKEVKQAVLDLLFLDIEIGEDISGIAIAKEIHSWTRRPLVIFISNSDDLMHTSFEAQPLYFIRKTRIEEDLVKAYSILDEIKFYSNDQIEFVGHSLPVSEIRYVDSSDHKVTFHLREGNIVCRATLAAVEDALNDYSFVRIHRSYVINLREVARHFSDRVILKDGKEIDIGRKYYPSFKEIYKEAKLNGLL